MLQQMRKVAKSRVSSVLLVGLAASFGVWGIADVFRGGGGDTSVATVGGTQIPVEAFQRDYQNFLRNLGARSGKDITQEEAQKQGVPDRVLQSIINRTALDEEVGKLGLTVSDAQVTAQIRSNPAFTGQLGTFDHQVLQQRLQEIGYTEQGFIDSTRSDTARDQLLAATRNGFLISAGLGHALFDYLNEKRAVQYVVVPAAAAGTIADPGDAVLTAYVKANPDRFSMPEYREVTYAVIGPEDITGQTKISDTQISQEYDQRKDDPRYAYVIPETRDVEQLNFRDAASAKAARTKIDGGMSFADLAKSLGTAPVSLGTVTKSSLSDRGDAVFALPPNGVTQPVKNIAGYALFHVTKIAPGTTKTLADVKDDITKDLTARLAASKLDDVDSAYTDASSAGASLPEAAKKVGMRVVHVPAVDQSGLTPDGSKANVPADPEILDQIFKSEVDQDGDPFAVKDGHHYVLKIDSVTPKKLKPFAAVRSQALAMWLADAHQKALARKADALAAQASAQHSLAPVAKTLGATPKSSDALSRDTASGDLPAELVTRIYAVPPGKAVAGPAATGDGYIVALVTGVFHPPAPTANPEYQKFIQQVSTSAADDIGTSVAMAARGKLGVKINQKQVDQATGGSGS
ncbi:MAG TPA: SurA N-terminal domain-containing protein [Rhizomicrobium sp.]|nr:SurA N-terminal domain-containing protein [Rhizomicrobium sp.]